MLELIQSIAFTGLFLVSTGLGIILYTGLSHDTLSFIIMLIVAIVIECVKILSLTWSNTEMWRSSEYRKSFIDDYIKGMFRRSNRSKIRNGKLLKAVIAYSRHKRKGFGLFAVYIFSAFLSISASYGYISQTVYISTQKKSSLDTSSTQDIYNAQLKMQDEFIAQDQKDIANYSRQQDFLDQTSKSYQWRYDDLQRKIDKSNVDINKHLGIKQEINNTIQGLQLAAIQKNQTLGKTMYQLMGESLHISDRTVMFILLYLLAVMIEIGLFVTSPHFRGMDKDDGVIIGTEKQKDATPSTENTNTEIPSINKLSPAGIYQMEEVIESPPNPNQDIVTLMKKSGTDPLIFKNAESLEKNIPEEVVVKPELEKVEEQPTIRKTDKLHLIDVFIDNLFDANNVMRAKEKVATEIGLPLVHAIKIIDHLTHQKGFVQPRPGVGWFRIASYDDIKKEIAKLYKGIEI